MAEKAVSLLPALALFPERRRALIEAAMEKLTALSARHSYAEHIARLEKMLLRGASLASDSHEQQYAKP